MPYLNLSEMEVMMAFANFCDADRLYELEFAGKMPKGSANKFVREGLDYLIRIVQLERRFRGGGYPGPRIEMSDKPLKPGDTVGVAPDGPAGQFEDPAGPSGQGESKTWEIPEEAGKMEQEQKPAAPTPAEAVKALAAHYRRGDGNVHAQSDATVRAAKVIAGMEGIAPKADGLTFSGEAADAFAHFVAQTGVDMEMFAGEIAKAKGLSQIQ